MKILITNIILSKQTGTEVFVRDLAIELHNRGVSVEVYSPLLGKVAEEISKAGIHIVDSPEDLILVPDLIHGHHFIPTMDAMLKFPNVPAIYFQHDRLLPADSPPKHSRVMKYIAVDNNCLERLIIDNRIAEKDTMVLYNWVDTDRFKLRTKISDKPLRALVFSNYATNFNHFKKIQEACNQIGLQLDGIGIRLGNEVEKPEDILGNYDIVFAKAKAAMEALATGADLIVCDYDGLGGTVNSQNFEHFRKFNFGMKTMTRPIETELIIQEIKNYDPEEIIVTAHMIRENASFNVYVDKILELYKETIYKFINEGKRPETNDRKTIRKYLFLKKKNKILKPVFNFLTKIKEKLKKADNNLFNGTFFKLFKPVYRKFFY